MSILIVSEHKKSELTAALADSKISITKCGFKDYAKALNSGEIKLTILDSEDRANAGLKLLKKIKKGWPKIPIIFVSSAATEDSIIEAFRQGARDFFKKPVQAFQLKKTVQNLLKISNKPQESRTQIVSRAQSIASPYEKATTDLPENILRIINHMEEHLAEDLDLEDYAKKAGMSKFHFCRTFKKYMELSPMQFLAHMRMNRAKIILGCSRRSVSEVADEVGFSDLSNFIKNFKKVVGVTPTNYRKTARKKSN